MKKATVKEIMKSVRFVHCRNLNNDGSISPRGGMTIAYTMTKENKVVGWAAARCNAKDIYNKHVGRMKAAGRMLSADWYQECPELDEKEFIKNSKEGYAKAF